MRPAARDDWRSITVSDWRDFGDTTFEAWTAVLQERAPASPILGEGRAAYEAASPHSRLCLGMMWIEGQFATDFDANPAGNRNPMNMKTPDGSGWVEFSTWTDGIRGWRDRITSPTYKNGIYAGTTTLAELIHIYAPADDNNDEQEYRDAIETITGELKSREQPGGPTPVGNLNMTKGLIPMPPLEDHIVDVGLRCLDDWDEAARTGRGYDNLGLRRIDALYVHRSNGTWTSNINTFDSACPGALTDLQIDHEDGRMMRFVRLNPPGQDADGPSGWANGAASDPIGDAAKLIAKHGGQRSAVNQFAESCEVTGFFGAGGDTEISEAARDTIARWFASRAHDYGIPWDSFPIIPDEGRSFIVGHRESRGGGDHDCPGNFLWSLIGTKDADLMLRARAIMKAAQAQPTTPVFAKRTPIPGPVKERVLNGRLYLVSTPRRRTLLIDAAQYAGPDASPENLASDTKLKAGKTVTVPYVVAGTDGTLFLASESGTHLRAAAFVPVG
jgi:hypothetical protein